MAPICTIYARTYQTQQRGIWAYPIECNSGAAAITASVIVL